jgi:hypothetical protein
LAIARGNHGLVLAPRDGMLAPPGDGTRRRHPLTFKPDHATATARILEMSRLCELMILVAMCALAGCQSNTAGKPGYVPSNCAMPGSTCDGR